MRPRFSSVPAKRKRATLLVGAGRMGGALLKGWISNGLSPLTVIEPSPSPSLEALARANTVTLLRSIDEIGDIPVAACVVALKPQILAVGAQQLKPVAAHGALMLSIAAGTRIATLQKAWGRRARIVRAMPNTPGAIGQGITALYAPRGMTGTEKLLAEALVSGLGTTVWVKSEQAIDVVTAVSGSGPAYVFLLAECLAAAAEAEGMPRATAEKLARATITGAGALLAADTRAVSDLRHDVTSPGGTTQAALNVLTGEMPGLLARAVAAARKRAAELGYTGKPGVSKARRSR